MRRKTRKPLDLAETIYYTCASKTIQQIVLASIITKREWKGTSIYGKKENHGW